MPNITESHPILRMISSVVILSMKIDRLKLMAEHILGSIFVILAFFESIITFDNHKIATKVLLDSKYSYIISSSKLKNKLLEVYHQPIYSQEK